MVAVKSVPVKIKSKALTVVPLEYTHDTIYMEKKSERKLAITSTSLELHNHARVLTLLSNVSSPSEHPPIKSRNTKNAS